MVGQNAKTVVRDAADVPLRMGAKDTFLFGEKTPDDARERAIDTHIPQLFTFLLRHMANTAILPARPSQNCDWCLYRNLCIITPR